MNWSKSGRINDVVQQNLRSFRALTWSILSKVLTLYKQNTINTRRSTAPTTQTGITQFGSFLEGAATLVSGVNSVPTCVRITEALLTKRDVTICYLLTESEVIKGKSQTRALMYWPSDSARSIHQGRGLRFVITGHQFLFWKSLHTKNRINARLI